MPVINGVEKSGCEVSSRGSNSSEPASTTTMSVNGEGDSIKLLIRIRPMCSEVGGVDAGGGTCLEIDEGGKTVIMKTRPEPRRFTFDEVAGESYTQEAVFCSVGKKIVESCVTGYNGTIFAYGQTGSGKTFTMLGPSDVGGGGDGGGRGCFQSAMRGVIPRCVDYLFKLIQQEKELHGERIKFTCRCSFLEIYNEQIFDLLEPTGGALSLRESVKDGVYVDRLKEEVVVGVGDAHKVLGLGWRNRTVAETMMNRESSRSHAVFSLIIESRVEKNDVWNVKTSRLHLVDLAGSERQKDTNSSGQRLREAGNINKSLSVLGKVITALVDITNGKNKHIPYRESKLSFLLRDSLGGNSRTCIVACVHAGSRCFGETLSTLQFAQRAKMIKNRAVINEDMQGSVTHLQAEIRRLAEEIRLLKLSKPVTTGCIHCETGSTNVNTPYKLHSNDVSRSVSVASDSGDLTEQEQDYKNKFIKAMLLRKRSESEKQILEDKIRRLEDTIQRKDHAYRQSRMVLKFREEAVRRLDKAVKDKQGLKADLSMDDKDYIIDCLRGEVSSLQSIVDKYPEMSRSIIDYDVMKAELDSLREFQAQALRAHELEDEYSELQHELTEEVINPDSEPMCPQTDLTAAMATVTKQQQQISELQAANDKLKTELGAEIERLTRQQIEEKAELVSVCKAKEELEKLLKNYRIRTQVERETREDLHSKTIKIMTTPRKSLAFGAGTSPSARGLSPSPLAAPICEDGPPGTPVGVRFSPHSPHLPSLKEEQDGSASDLSESQLDALTSEIKHLQEELRKVKVQLEESETGSISMISEKSHIEAQYSLLTELYEKEKNDWLRNQKQIESELEQLKAEHSKLTDHNKYQKSELDDLRILSAASDNKIREMRQESNQYKMDVKLQLEQLEGKIIKLTEESTQLQQELDSACEERDLLKESEETLQATCDYTTDRLSTVEQSLVEQTNKNKQLEINLEDRELLEAFNSVESLRKDLQNKSEELQTKLEQINELRSGVELLQSENERLMKANSKKEEAVSVMTEKLSELRNDLHNSHTARDTLTVELEQARRSTYELQGQCNALEERLTAQAAANVDTTNKLQQLAKSKEVDYEMLQEDYQYANTRVDSLLSQVDQELKKTALLTDRNKELEDYVSQLISQIKELQSSMDDNRSKNEILEQQLTSTNTQLASCQMELSGTVEYLDTEKTFSNQWQQKVEAVEQEYKLQLNNLTTRNTELERRIAALEPMEQKHAAEVDGLQRTIEEIVRSHDEMRSETEIYKNEIESLKQMNEKISKDLTTQLEENAKLSGHQNLNQRIHYTEKLTKEVKIARQVGGVCSNLSNHNSSCLPFRSESANQNSGLESEGGARSDAAKHGSIVKFESEVGLESTNQNSGLESGGEAKSDLINQNLAMECGGGLNQQHGNNVPEKFPHPIRRSLSNSNGDFSSMIENSRIDKSENYKSTAANDSARDLVTCVNSGRDEDVSLTLDRSVAERDFRPSHALAQCSKVLPHAALKHSATNQELNQGSDKSNDQGLNHLNELNAHIVSDDQMSGVRQRRHTSAECMRSFDSHRSRPSASRRLSFPETSRSADAYMRIVFNKEYKSDSRGFGFKKVASRNCDNRNRSSEVMGDISHGNAEHASRENLCLQSRGNLGDVSCGNTGDNSGGNKRKFSEEISNEYKDVPFEKVEKISGNVGNVLEKIVLNNKIANKQQNAEVHDEFDFKLDELKSTQSSLDKFMADSADYEKNEFAVPAVPSCHRDRFQAAVSENISSGVKTKSSKVFLVTSTPSHLNSESGNHSNAHPESARDRFQIKLDWLNAAPQKIVLSENLKSCSDLREVMFDDMVVRDSSDVLQLSHIMIDCTNNNKENILEDSVNIKEAENMAATYDDKAVHPTDSIVNLKEQKDPLKSLNDNKSKKFENSVAANKINHNTSKIDNQIRDFEQDDLTGIDHENWELAAEYLSRSKDAVFDENDESLTQPVTVRSKSISNHSLHSGENPSREVSIVGKNSSFRQPGTLLSKQISNVSLYSGETLNRSQEAVIVDKDSSFTDFSVTQAGLAQPGIAQPVSTQPGIAQPVSTQPGIAQPVSTQPGIAQPGIAQPVSTQPGIAQPVSTQPGIAQPVSAQPGIAQPISTQSVFAQQGKASSVSSLSLLNDFNHSGNNATAQMKLLMHRSPVVKTSSYDLMDKPSPSVTRVIDSRGQEKYVLNVEVKKLKINTCTQRDMYDINTAEKEKYNLSVQVEDQYHGNDLKVGIKEQYRGSEPNAESLENLYAGVKLDLDNGSDAIKKGMDNNQNSSLSYNGQDSYTIKNRIEENQSSSADLEAVMKVFSSIECTVTDKSIVSQENSSISDRVLPNSDLKYTTSTVSSDNNTAYAVHKTDQVTETSCALFDGIVVPSAANNSNLHNSIYSRGSINRASNATGATSSLFDGTFVPSAVNSASNDSTCTVQNVDYSAPELDASRGTSTKSSSYSKSSQNKSSIVYYLRGKIQSYSCAGAHNNSPDSLKGVMNKPISKSTKKKSFGRLSFGSDTGKVKAQNNSDFEQNMTDSLSSKLDENDGSVVAESKNVSKLMVEEKNDLTKYKQYLQVHFDNSVNNSEKQDGVQYGGQGQDGSQEQDGGPEQDGRNKEGSLAIANETDLLQQSLANLREGDLEFSRDYKEKADNKGTEKSGKKEKSSHFKRLRNHFEGAFGKRSSLDSATVSLMPLDRAVLSLSDLTTERSELFKAGGTRKWLRRSLGEESKTGSRCITPEFVEYSGKVSGSVEKQTSVTKRSEFKIPNVFNFRRSEKGKGVELCKTSKEFVGEALSNSDVADAKMQFVVSNRDRLYSNPAKTEQCGRNISINDSKAESLSDVNVITKPRNWDVKGRNKSEDSICEDINNLTEDINNLNERKRFLSTKYIHLDGDLRRSMSPLLRNDSPLFESGGSDMVTNPFNMKYINTGFDNGGRMSVQSEPSARVTEYGIVDNEGRFAAQGDRKVVKYTVLGNKSFKENSLVPSSDSIRPCTPFVLDSARPSSHNNVDSNRHGSPFMVNSVRLDFHLDLDLARPSSPFMVNSNRPGSPFVLESNRPGTPFIHDSPIRVSTPAARFQTPTGKENQFYFRVPRSSSVTRSSTPAVTSESGSGMDRDSDVKMLSDLNRSLLESVARRTKELMSESGRDELLGGNSPSVNLSSSDDFL